MCSRAHPDTAVLSEALFRVRSHRFFSSRGHVPSSVDSEAEQTSGGDTTSAIPPAPTGEADTTRPAHALYGLAIWGFGQDDVWAVGVSGTIVHFDGKAWTSQVSGTNHDLEAVWGATPDSLLVTGLNGVILRHVK